MIEQKEKATNLTRKSPGRPRLYENEKTHQVVCKIPKKWDNEKIESGQTWRYVIRKGLDKVSGQTEFDENSKKIRDMQEEFNILRRNFNLQVLDKKDLKDEVERLNNQIRKLKSSNIDD